MSNIALFACLHSTSLLMTRLLCELMHETSFYAIKMKCHKLPFGMRNRGQSIIACLYLSPHHSNENEGSVLWSFAHSSTCNPEVSYCRRIPKVIFCLVIICSRMRMYENETLALYSPFLHSFLSFRYTSAGLLTDDEDHDEHEGNDFKLHH